MPITRQPRFTARPSVAPTMVRVTSVHVFISACPTHYPVNHRRPWNFQRLAAAWSMLKRVFKYIFFSVMTPTSTPRPGPSVRLLHRYDTGLPAKFRRRTSRCFGGDLKHTLSTIQSAESRYTVNTDNPGTQRTDQWAVHASGRHISRVSCNQSRRNSLTSHTA